MNAWSCTVVCETCYTRLSPKNNVQGITVRFSSVIPASIASRIRLTFVRTFEEAVDHVMPPVRPEEVDLSRGA